MDRTFYFSGLCPVHFSEAVHVLRDEPAVLAGMSRNAALRVGAEHHGAHVHGHVGLAHHVHDVAIDVGEADRVDARAIMVPVHLEEEHHRTHWFPDVDGEFEVTAYSETLPACELSFFGSYHPHYGILGAGVDRLGGHRLAESALAKFFEEAADRLIRTILLEHELREGALPV